SPSETSNSRSGFLDISNLKLPVGCEINPIATGKRIVTLPSEAAFAAVHCHESVECPSVCLQCGMGKRPSQLGYGNCSPAERIWIEVGPLAMNCARAFAICSGVALPK